MLKLVNPVSEQSSSDQFLYKWAKEEGYPIPGFGN